MSLASPCFGVSDEPRNLDKLLQLSLQDKIVYSLAKIKEFYIAMKGKVYVSYSGGKDSTVLLHLVRSVYPEIPAVFVDTGLEFPEIREHARATENLVIVKPQLSFRKVIETKGYPVIGKEVAHWIDLAQRGMPSGIRQVNSDGRFGVKRYGYLVDAPFRVSRDCCDILKKEPARRYSKETGRAPYLGMRADESRLRREAWVIHGENDTGSKRPSSSPLSIWTDKDVWGYIRENSLTYATVYDKGYERTGCIFCMFGITQDRDRFLKLKATHPDLWEYCMRDWDEGGLGMKTVLDYIGIPSGCGQTLLEDFA